MARAQLFTVSAPSGAGKTSLVKALLDSVENLVVSVSHTTRTQRQGEVDGQDYYFVSEEEFLARIDAGEFLEHARVFDNYYGTTRTTVEANLAAGRDVLLEIDWQGARQVHQQLPDTRGIFILPPSRAVLIERLRGRGQDSEEVIERRTREAVLEMSHYREADYLIINDDFDTARRSFAAVIESTRLECAVQSERHASLIASLLANDAP